MDQLHRGRLRFGAALAMLSVPLLAYVYLTMLAPRYDRTVAVPLEHFYIVSAASLTALVLAIVVGIASVRTREPQTLLVAIGFLAIAGVFSVHGLSTPGARMLVKDMHHSLLISARLSLFLGSLFFLIGSYELPPRLRRAMRRRHGSLLLAAIAVVGIYIGANLAKPDLLDSVPTGASKPAITHHPRDNREQTPYSTYTEGAPEPVTPPSDVVSPAERFGRALDLGMAFVAILCFGVAGWRFYRTYAIARTPATGALAAGMLLLAEAQVIMAFGDAWKLSWWAYHASMLVGFAIPVGSFGRAYARGSSLIEIVDGLFVRDALARIERSFPEAISDLIAVIEQKDPYLRGHMRRVGDLTVRIAEEMRLPSETTRAASHAALLHDVGKLGLPQAILNKPGKLTDAEFNVLKTHPERGFHMVSQAPALHAAAPAIRWHHERLDGSGYPDGLHGAAIPIEARIVAVADAWDALTSDRVYRRALPSTAARDVLLAEAGTRLDDQCIGALFAVLDRITEPAVAFPARPTARSLDRPQPGYLAS